MIDRNDVEARLKLFRYGLLVIVAVTFVISLSYPAILLGFVGQPLTDFILPALLYTAVVAVISVGIYFGYSRFLRNKGE